MAETYLQSEPSLQINQAGIQGSTDRGAFANSIKQEERRKKQKNKRGKSKGGRTLEKCVGDRS